MPGVRTTLVTKNHAYTGEAVPWRMDTEDVEAAPLFRLLRGGGVRAFGSTSAQAAQSMRQTRFLWFAGALAVVWLFFWLW